LRAAGLPIEATWIDCEFNHTGAPCPDFSLHWRKCIEEAAAADILILYAAQDESQMGALVECGAALGAGKQVFLVTPHDWSIEHHPRVKRFPTLEAAVQAIRLKWPN
jgi:hypothetical protein